MYQSTPSASRRILVVLALLLFIVALVLVIVQSMTGKGVPKISGSYDKGYAEGFNAARDMAKAFNPQIAEARTTLFGTVKQVSGDKVTFEADGLFVDERADGVGTVRTAVAGAETKVVSAERIPMEELAGLMKTYERAMAAFDPSSGKALPEQPASEVETVIALSDLAPGDRIRVSGAAGEDLTFAASISASKIVRVEPETLDDAMTGGNAEAEPAEPVTGTGGPAVAPAEPVTGDGGPPIEPAEPYMGD
jgi:hypothetical protein